MALSAAEPHTHTAHTGHVVGDFRSTCVQSAA